MTYENMDTWLKWFALPGLRSTPWHCQCEAHTISCDKNEDCPLGWLPWHPQHCNIIHRPLHRITSDASHLPTPPPRLIKYDVHPILDRNLSLRLVSLHCPPFCFSHFLVLHCINVLYCTALYYTVLHCTILYRAHYTLRSFPYDTTTCTVTEELVHPTDRTPNNPTGEIRHRNIHEYLAGFILEHRRYSVSGMAKFCFPCGSPYKPVPLQDPATVLYSSTDQMEEEVQLVFLEVYFLLLSSFARSRQEHVPYERGQEGGGEKSKDSSKKQCPFSLSYLILSYYLSRTVVSHVPFSSTSSVFSSRLTSSYVTPFHLLLLDLNSSHPV